jgi:hypothetical protein
MQANEAKLQSDIDSLNPADRVRLLLKVAEFVIPRYQSIEYVNESDTENSIIKPLVININADSNK